MSDFIQSVADIGIHFGREPKELFRGVELFATWIQIGKGGTTPTIDKIIFEFRLVQDYLSFPLALGSCAVWLREVTSVSVSGSALLRKGLVVLSCIAAGAGVLLEQFFKDRPSEKARWEKFEAVADIFSDVLSIKDEYEKEYIESRLKTYTGMVRITSSLALSVFSLANLDSSKNITLQRVSLVFKTVYFTSKVASIIVKK